MVRPTTPWFGRRENRTTATSPDVLDHLYRMSVDEYERSPSRDFSRIVSRADQRLAGEENDHETASRRRG